MSILAVGQKDTETEKRYKKNGGALHGLAYAGMVSNQGLCKVEGVNRIWNTDHYSIGFQ